MFKNKSAFDKIMERSDCYSYPSTDSKERTFIRALEEKGFQYNPFRNGIIVEGLTDSLIASKFYCNGRMYIIIPQDLESESDIKKQQRLRLRNLVDAFQS